MRTFLWLHELVCCSSSILKWGGILILFWKAVLWLLFQGSKYLFVLISKIRRVGASISGILLIGRILIPKLLLNQWCELRLLLLITESKRTFRINIWPCWFVKLCSTSFIWLILSLSIILTSIRKNFPIIDWITINIQASNPMLSLSLRIRSTMIVI